MPTILRRALKLFSISALFLTVVLAVGYFIDVAGGGFIRRWIFDAPDKSDSEPVLYVHVIWRIEDLAGLFLVYFALCIVFAWVWTWLKARRTS